MCDLCNGLSMRQMVDKVRLGVVRYGWMVQGVEGELAGSASAYTVRLKTSEVRLRTSERGRYPAPSRSPSPVQPVARSPVIVSPSLSAQAASLQEGLNDRVPAPEGAIGLERVAAVATR